MLVEIKKRISNEIIVVGEYENIRDAVEKNKSNLSGSDLSNSDLRFSNLSGSNLSGSNLRFSNLSGIKMNWQSHDLIAEILLRSAGDDYEKRSIAGLILVSRGWCWDKFIALPISDKIITWFIDTLAPFAENSEPPEEFRNLCAKLSKSKSE
jgi:hypothetical protein